MGLTDLRRMRPLYIESSNGEMGGHELGFMSFQGLGREDMSGIVATPTGKMERVGSGHTDPLITMVFIYFSLCPGSGAS